MAMPLLTQRKQRRDTQTAFKGYNNRLSCEYDEFKEMRNMSADEYPMLAPRKARRLIRTISGGRTLLGGDTLSWVENGTLYYGNKAVVSGVSADAQLVRMGAYLIAWPDRIIYNTHTGETMRMDATWTGNGVHVRPCMISGQEYTYTASDDEPENPRDMQYWLNTVTNGLYQYLGGVWTGIDTVYSRIECLDIGKNFRDYDVVTISGMDDATFNIDGATIYARGDDYLVIAAGIITDFENVGDVTVKREAPELDAICENGNRLWGYSNKTHEIRCTKLGDPTNWSAYLGISTDSYAATVGSQGDFTGIYNYMGYVHFFKEHRVHRLYGTQPSNFQLVELQMRGVKKGCGKSLCVVNEMLYYMSQDGIVRYDGSAPVDLSEPLGDMQLTDVVCGAEDKKLYVSAIADGNPLMLVLDTGVWLWHVEDDLRAAAFANTEEGAFCLDDSGHIWNLAGKHSALEGADARDEDPFDWYAVSGDLLAETGRQRSLRTPQMQMNRLEIRLEMERGAQCAVEVQYNSDGKWQRILTYSTEVKKAITLPLVARACDHMAFRISGRGRTVLYTLTRIYEAVEGRTCLSYRG